MINILYNGRIIYHHISDEEVPKILLELASDENINENQIEIEEV
jgi:hypothetical protein